MKRQPTETNILASYGQLMLQLQVTEMNFWILRAAKLKKGMSDAQVLEAMKKWDRTTFGDLVRGLKSQGHFEEDTRWKLGQLLELRNHVAHNFLREFFVVKGSPVHYREGLSTIERWQALVQDLDEDLTAYIDEEFGEGWNKLSDAEWAEIAKLQPTSWPLIDSDESS